MPSTRVRLDRSCRILSPRLSSGIGLFIQERSAGGDHDWSIGRVTFARVASSQNFLKLHFDSASAIEAKGVEQRVTLVMFTSQPMPAATLAMAETSVVDRGQERL